MGNRESVYSCPRCDKPLRAIEIENKKCSNCDLEFKVTKDTNVAIYQERELVAKLASEVFGVVGTRTNHYLTAINMLKGAFNNVVYVKGVRHTTFYRVVDGELRYFLFRLDRTKSTVRIEFDMRMAYKRVKNYTDAQRTKSGMGRIKSCLTTPNFEYMIEVCMAVAERKNKRYGAKIQGEVGLVVKY